MPSSPSLRRLLPRVAAPIAAVAMLAACAGEAPNAAGSGDGGGGGDAKKAASELAAVTPEKLKGTTIKLSLFFGACEDTTKGVTDVTKAKTECETIQILRNAFNAENKHGIKVEQLGGTAWKSYYDTLNAAYAGGTAPDVAAMHGSRLTGYTKRNLLYKLDDHLKVTGADIEDAAPAAREAVTYEKATYGLPFDLHAALVHLNVALFKKAGLVDADGKPKMPTSPEEFLAHAAQMKAKTGKNYFGTARVNDGLGSNMWRALVWQQGSNLLNEDNTKATVDTPESRKALDFIDKVFGKYADPNQTYDAAQTAFLKGETAMLMNGTWVVDQYDKEAPFDYLVANFPNLYGKPATWADSHTWVIPQQKNGDPVRYRAALEFVSYLYEHSGDWATNTGHLAARKSVLNSDEYKKAPQRANYVNTGTESAHTNPRVTNWPAADDAIVKNLDAIWFKKTSVDAALTSMAREVDAALAKNR